MARWERREVGWWETNVTHCAFCGQMIPRDVWRSDDGLGFCNAECEGLYRAYWVPRYGAKGAQAGGKGGE